MDDDFVAYVEARTPALLRLAYLMTGDAHRAEDLVQEALTKAHTRWEGVTAAEHPHAYVRRMVVNQHLSWRRRRASGEVAVPPEAMPEQAAGDLAGDLAARDATWRMLAQLPVRQRAVLVLRYYEDLSDADIARTLDVAVGTVRSLAARAFARLREHPDLAAFAAPGPTPAPPLVATTAQENR